MIPPPYEHYTNTYEYTSHTYYTLYNTPQEPMAEPWTDVLDYACDWASGQSTLVNVAKEITEEIYYMGDLDGDLDYPDNKTSNYSEFGIYNFYLSSFLSDVLNRSDVKVNCHDCAMLVHTFTAAVGFQSRMKRIKWDNKIDTKEIDPIGNKSWQSISWGNHQYGWINSTVYDACIRVDRYGSPRIPANMNQNDHINFIADDPPDNASYYIIDSIL